MSKFTLPALPYDYDALEPHFDAKTMEIHHTKHHQTYVDKLNAAIEGESWFEGKSLEEIVTGWEEAPEGKKDMVRNHGGGHINHSLLWEILTPGDNDKLSKELEDKIKSDFKSKENCIEAVTDTAATHFGSGWAWLVLNKNGKLEAFATPNQNSPYMYGYKPLLGIDVWEHAYYLKYQNKRPDYIEAFWKVVNWDQVSKNLN
jgi:superoxide dismutase, Fe-Mn family